MFVTLGYVLVVQFLVKSSWKHTLRKHLSEKDRRSEAGMFLTISGWMFCGNTFLKTRAYCISSVIITPSKSLVSPQAVINRHTILALRASMYMYQWISCLCFVWPYFLKSVNGVLESVASDQLSTKSNFRCVARKWRLVSRVTRG